VPFRDWSEDDYEQFKEDAEQNIFREMDSQPLSDEQYEEAQALFEAGWLTFGEYSKESLDAIRDAFYDLMGIDEDQFDWQEYRDLYSEAG
jgi:hypothetical protein